MKNQKGVTLVSLVTTIILLLIILSISASTSMSTYKNMKYETFKTELQEVQDAVNKMCEDYSLATEVSTSSIDDYEDYFTYRYSSVPSTITTAIDNSAVGASDILTLYPSINSSYTYYFSQDDIKTYFNLEVTLKGVLVDFSTRYVYSAEGCVDPDDNDTTYYTLSEMDGETNIYENTTESASTLTGITVTSNNSSSATTLLTSGDTKLLKITLTAVRGASSGMDYPIKKAYYSYSSDGSTYSANTEVKYLGDCTYADDGNSVSFVIYDAGYYIFYLEDTSGKLVSASAIQYQ